MSSVAVNSLSSVTEVDVPPLANSSSMGRMREALEDDLKEQQRVETRRSESSSEDLAIPPS